MLSIKFTEVKVSVMFPPNLCVMVGFSTANTVDSARANLAASFVNGFVNAAFGEDKLISETKWIYKHKGSGMFSATASLGLILLWDVEGGLTQIDKLLYSNEDYIKVCMRVRACTKCVDVVKCMDVVKGVCMIKCVDMVKCVMQ